MPDKTGPLDLSNLPDDIISGRLADADLFGSITADAFVHDPFNQWVFRSDAAIRTIFHTEARHLYLPKGICHRIAAQACTMWMGPDTRDDLPHPVMPGLLLKLLRHSGVGGVKRALATGALMAKQKPREPHLYLFTIAVQPEHQGKGLGHRLLAPVLHAADKAGLPTYLENSNPANHAFYASHGFQTQDRLQVTPDAPPLVAMWREPRRDGSELTR